MRDSSPLGEEGVDDSVSQRIDGQLWDPLEIFSAADRKRIHLKMHNIHSYIHTTSHHGLQEHINKFLAGPAE